MEALSRTSIDRESLARIATLAVGHVEGLEAHDETARVEVDEDGALRVRLRVRGHWGAPLPLAASRLRREVVRVVRAMTGLHVAQVDVEVAELLADPGEAPAVGQARTGQRR